MGVVNYFKDHLRDHSAVEKPLYEMVALATIFPKNKGSLPDHRRLRRIQKKLKALVNSGPKLYFIDYQLAIILYTDASYYAHGAYLCQLRRLTDGITVEEPIRLMIEDLLDLQVIQPSLGYTNGP